MDPKADVLGPIKIKLCERLVSDWPLLADYFGIEPAERARFDKGWEPQRVWEWLDDRGKLARRASNSAKLIAPSQ